MYNTLTVSRWYNDAAYQIVLYPAQQVQQGSNLSSSIKSTTTIDLTGSWSQVNGRGYNWWAAAAYAPDIGANGKYVAVPYLSGSPGGSWDFMVSTDLAASWSSVTPPVRNSWTDIIWSKDDNQFVALAGVGYTDLTGGGVKRVAISSDGSTWTEVTTPSANNYGPDWWSLAYGNGTYVAVARSYSGGPTDRLIMSSPNAVNWTTRSMPVSGSLRSVAYGNGTFVAISEDLSIILTSSDGATWTQQTSPNFGTQGTFFNLEYGGGIFCALACPSSETSSLTAMAVWSTDGINWNAKTIPTPARQWGLLKGLAYGRTGSFTGFYALARYGRSWSGSAPYDANQTLLMRAPILNPLPEPSATVTPTPTPTVTPSSTPAVSPSVTPTVTSSITPSISITATITPSITPSISIPATITPSITPSLTPTPSQAVVTDALFNLLTNAASITAYNAAPINSWVPIVSSEYYSLSSSLAGIKWYGTNDIGVANNSTGTSFNAALTMAMASGTNTQIAPSGSYLVGFMVRPGIGSTNFTSFPMMSYSYLGTYFSVGSAAYKTPASVTGTSAYNYYFIRKAPTDSLSALAYAGFAGNGVGSYAYNNISTNTPMPTSYSNTLYNNTGTLATAASAIAPWTNYNSNLPVFQVLGTTIKNW